MTDIELRSVHDSNRIEVCHIQTSGRLAGKSVRHRPEGIQFSV